MTCCLYGQQRGRVRSHDRQHTSTSPPSRRKHYGRYVALFCTFLFFCFSLACYKPPSKRSAPGTPKLASAAAFLFSFSFPSLHAPRIPHITDASTTGRRTLRSGKEFSAFDLALGRAITTPALDFDTGRRIKEVLDEQALGTLHDDLDDLDDLIDSTLDLTLDLYEPEDPAPHPAVPLAHSIHVTPTVRPPSPQRVSAAQNDKNKSKLRRAKQRDAARLASTNPAVKAVCRRRIAEAKAHALHTAIESPSFSHTRTAWIGRRDPPTTPKRVELETSIGGRIYSEAELEALNEDTRSGAGMGGRVYTQAEIDAIVGVPGFMYIAWLGMCVIPFLI